MVGSAPPTRQTLALGRTSIWDAIWFTSEKVFAQSAKERRQTIILVTDGQDTNSQRKIEDAIERAVELNIVVYAIGVGEKKQLGVTNLDCRSYQTKQVGKRSFLGQKKR